MAPPSQCFSALIAYIFSNHILFHTQARNISIYSICLSFIDATVRHINPSTLISTSSQNPCLHISSGCYPDIPTSHHPSVHGNLYTPKDLSYVLGYSMSNMKGHIIHKFPHTAQPLKHPSTGTHREQPTHLELFIYPGGNNAGSMNVGQLKERWKAQCFWLIVTWAWLCTQHAAHLSAGDSLSLPWMCLSSPCQMPNAVTD